jgi:hypothetical protein
MTIKLRKGDKANFETLKRACDDGNLALLSSKRKSDGKDVALVCAVNWDADGGEYEVVPLAVLVEGNPFDEFEAPFVENSEN